MDSDEQEFRAWIARRKEHRRIKWFLIVYPTVIAAMVALAFYFDIDVDRFHDRYGLYVYGSFAVVAVVGSIIGRKRKGKK
jgi:hypothetical protein